MKFKFFNNNKLNITVFNSKKTVRSGFIFLFTYLCFIPFSALADVTSSLNDLQTILMGDWGKAMATIAIIGLGIGCFVMGKVSKIWFISIVIGIGLVFGAPTILSYFQG